MGGRQVRGMGTLWDSGLPHRPPHRGRKRFVSEGDGGRVKQ